MKELTTISSDLFNKIRSRFTDIKIGDKDGAITTNPADARFFDVNYTIDGDELGRVNLKIDDDSLTVIYNEAMLDGQADSVRVKWFDFLKELRQFARKNLLTFDTRDITKSNLEKRDYAYLAQNGDTSMSESKLFGTSKTSYQDVGEAKIIVKHSAPINYNNPAGRTQRIESIYIESSSGERFKYPSRHLNGARAMAVHVANGGAPYDAMGGYISGLSEELSKLRQFKQYTQRSGVMAEALGDITSKVAERIEHIKTEISGLQRQAKYEAFRESFEVSESQEVPEEMMTSWVDALTIKTFNEELKGVFPYIYKLVSEKRSDELTFDDIVAEAATCETCNEDPCSCDDTMEEMNHLADFEQHLDTITRKDYDGVMESEMDLPSETLALIDEYISKIEPDANRDEMIQAVIDGTIHTSEIEYALQDEPTESVESSPVTQEVLEFITSMYDPQSQSFPRGEEGVKISVEKKFGEGAARFAHYVVEKLSANSGNDMAEMQAEQETVAAEPMQVSPELEHIRRLSGI